MSEFDNLDNAGSGFVLDDGEDLSYLLSEAESHEEDDNERTDIYFQDSEQPSSAQPPAKEEESNEPAPQVTSENVVEEESVIVEPEPVVEPVAYDDPEPVQEHPETQEVYEPEPVHNEPREHSWADSVDPVPTPQVNETYETPRVSVPKNASVEQVAQIIRILDAYRQLNSEEKTVASQFITVGETLDNEEEFVVSVLNVDPMLTKTMKALKEAKDRDPVDRAFFVVDLERNLLKNLGNLVSVFTGDEISNDQSHNQYSRQVVKNIEQLDNKDMSFVSATETVLTAAEGT